MGTAHAQPPSMPLAMAQAAAGMAGSTWQLFASFVGALGAFITGSNTVSDLLLAEFQFATAAAAKLFGVPPFPDGFSGSSGQQAPEQATVPGYFFPARAGRRSHHRQRRSTS